CSGCSCPSPSSWAAEGRSASTCSFACSWACRSSEQRRRPQQVRENLSSKDERLLAQASDVQDVLAFRDQVVAIEQDRAEGGEVRIGGNDERGARHDLEDRERAAVADAHLRERAGLRQRRGTARPAGGPARAGSGGPQGGDRGQGAPAEGDAGAPG